MVEWMCGFMVVRTLVSERRMKTDAELLQEFVKRDAENAFAELVNRHISVVYSAACRETQGDLSVAQDITQLVFIELVRKAVSLQSHPTLAGWLYTCVRYVSANLRRADHRRNMREEEASAMNELLRPAPNDPVWEEIRPALDDAMHELDDRDKDAVVLRFFEGKSLREVGDALRLTENAARMRVDRALEKLRKALAGRGVHSTSSVLAGVLAAGIVATPPALTASVTSSALAAATVAAGSTATLFGIMTLTKPAMVGLSALAVAAVSIPIWQQQRYERVAQENNALRAQVEQTDQLRQENQRLADLLKAADERAQSVGLEPSGLRAGAAVASKPNTGAQKEVSQGKPEKTWRQRFEEVYALRSGEVLRRIGTPFIPERVEYYRREFHNQRKGPGYLVLRQDGRGFRPLGAGFDQGTARLEDVLRIGLRLKRYDFYGSDELLGLVVPGDWVVRSGIESLLAALEPIFRDATGRNIHFEKQPVDSDVIVVRGSFAPAKEGQKFDVFAENRNANWAKSTHGGFQEFLEALGDQLNVPFVSQVQLQNKFPISWFCHADSDYFRAGDRRLELLNKVLENLKQQTSLSFELQRRPGEVWWVKEQR
jgi:RNA polymerase sigma factor (sigma-70 family)